MSRITRAFSHDIILSSNMAASIATEVNNIHLCKHLFTLLCRTVSPFVVQAHDDRMLAWCVWLPWISRSVCTIRWPCWKTVWRQWKHSIYCFVYMPGGILPRTYSENWRKRIIEQIVLVFLLVANQTGLVHICIKNNHNLSKKIDEDDFFFLQFSKYGPLHKCLQKNTSKLKALVSIIFVLIYHKKNK